MNRIIGMSPIEKWVRANPYTAKIKVTPGFKPYNLTVFRETDITSEEWMQMAQYLQTHFGIVFVPEESDPITTEEAVAENFPENVTPMFEVTVRPIAENNPIDSIEIEPLE